MKILPNVNLASLRVAKGEGDNRVIKEKAGMYIPSPTQIACLAVELHDSVGEDATESVGEDVDGVKEGEATIVGQFLLHHQNQHYLPLLDLIASIPA